MKRRDALAIRRQLKNIVAAVVDRYRLDPSGRVLFEIGFGQKAAIGTHKSLDLIGDLTFVETVAAFFANQPQRFRKRRILKNVALCRRPAFAIEGVGFQKCSGQIFVEARTKGPVIRNQVADGKTFLGVTNGRREIVTQLQFTKLFVQLCPGVDRPR